MKATKEIISIEKTSYIHTNLRLRCGHARNTATVRSLGQDLNVHPDLASALQDLSVDTLFLSIGQELRKLHFRVTHSEIIGYSQFNI